MSVPSVYAALTAAWNAGLASSTPVLPSGVTGTGIDNTMSPQQMLVAMQGWMIAGPLRDVLVALVIEYLASAGKLTALINYAKAPPSGDAQVSSIVAANDFLVMIQSPAITTISMSTPSVAAGIEALLAALVTDSANSNITSTDQAALLSLAATSLPWATAPTSIGGAGLTSQPNGWDLFNANLVTAEEAEAIESAGA